MPKVGVVLSGCGFMDGAEIHEATTTLLALDEASAQIICMAPDTNFEVVNHFEKNEEGTVRNVLAESARIARGEISDIAKITADELDAVIFPGGFGAAKNLCTWATQGADCAVDPNVERLIRDCHKAKKPLGFICIAPVLGAKILGEFGVKLTIGNDPNTAKGIEATGAVHVDKAVDEICADEANLVASTPAYMLGPSIFPVSRGIKKLVLQVMAWAK